METLTHILLVASVGIVVVAPLTGYWLAGRATRPLALIAQTASRARPGHLHERVPCGGSGDELDQLAGTFNGLLDRLATHLDRQRAFVANAAHELRSPLAALRASAEVALGQDRSPEEYRERLADIVEECDGLGVLVNQLLLLAEGEAGLVRTPKRFPLDRIAARVVAMFEGIAEMRGVSLAADLEPVAVWGSDIHLRQVLSNLVDNALKFTPPGGSVRVRVARRGRPRLRRGAGHRRGDERRGPVPRLRALLPRRPLAQARPRRHRAGAEHLPGARPRPRRHHRRGEPARRGDVRAGVRCPSRRNRTRIRGG